TGAHDGQVQPSRVHDLYADIGAKSKVLVDLACSSHNAMSEKNHRLLFQASLEWLAQGTVNGVYRGTVRFGYWGQVCKRAWHGGRNCARRRAFCPRGPPSPPDRVGKGAQSRSQRVTPCQRLCPPYGSSL